MDEKKVCTPPPPPLEDNLIVSEKLTTKQECSTGNTSSQFTLTVTEQTSDSSRTFHKNAHFSSSTTSTTSISKNDNFSAENSKKVMTSSRTELFASKIISTHQRGGTSSSFVTTTTTTNTVTKTTDNLENSKASSTNNSTTLCTSKTAPAACRRRRPKIKLNLQPDIVSQPQCSTRMYSASAPNSLNPKNICMMPIDSGYASPRGPDSNCLNSHAAREHGVRVLPNLYISGEDEARNPRFLKKHDIQAILSIQLYELPDEPRKSVESYKHIKLQDRPDVNIAKHFSEAIRFIDENKRTLVHCQAGISRSATLCLAYLIEKQQINLEAAFKQLQSKRGCIGPNFSFLGQLKTWETNVLKNPNNPSVQKFSLEKEGFPKRQTSTGIESASSADNSPDYKRIAEKQ